MPHAQALWARLRWLSPLLSMHVPPLIPVWHSRATPRPSPHSSSRILKGACLRRRM